MALFEFYLPELGENIETSQVIQILVKPGETIQKNQAVVELETEKAVFEVPSPKAGKIIEIKIKPGQKIKVGALLLTLETSEALSPNVTKTPSQTTSSKNQKGKASSRANLSAPQLTPPPVVEAKKTAPQTSSEIIASPKVRQLARELGLDLSQIQGSGEIGQILESDLQDFKNNLLLPPREDRNEGSASDFPHPTPLPGGEGKPLEKNMSHSILPDFSRWGSIERLPMSQIRLKTATHLSQAWQQIPHVTQFDRTDITELEELRIRFAKRVEAAGGKLTLTAILLKVAASALKVFPQLNSSVDLENEQIIQKHYIHIGVAVETERGLLVPVIQDVDQKNILELSVELKEISEKARAKKLKPDEMQGATFTITNLGGIGGTHFTPIVNWPEVAILGVGRAQIEPVWMKDRFEPKAILPLSLSYDHRLIDGADGARFLRWLSDAVCEPFLMDLEG